jgi:hypothetical protein
LPKISKGKPKKKLEKKSEQILSKRFFVYELIFDLFTFLFIYFHIKLVFLSFKLASLIKNIPQKLLINFGTRKKLNLNAIDH